MKRKSSFYLHLSILIVLLVATNCKTQPVHISFTWKTIAPLPDRFGFAGSFAGVSNNVLLVAGGANFPDGGAPWTGSPKVWHDTIFALSKPDGLWKVAGRLPALSGYGISVSWKGKLLCFGGSNADGHLTKSISVEYKNEVVHIDSLPDLPAPLANACGALLGDVVYIAGGIEKPDAKTAGKNFWSLDLASLNPSWKKLVSWPGEGRILSVAGVQDGCFYLMGGSALIDGNRKYLKDAFKYHPQTGWSKIADLPYPVVAAPSPAYNGTAHQLMIFGGDDGELASDAASLKEQHPGFSNIILKYDVNKDEWSKAGEIMTSKKKDAATNPNASVRAPVTTNLVLWNHYIILPGGEVRPATRTPNVLVATPSNK